MNYFKTEWRLKTALDNKDRIEGFENMLDNWRMEKLEIDYNDYSELPYYIDSLDYQINGTLDYTLENAIVEYSEGYYCFGIPLCLDPDNLENATKKKIEWIPDEPEKYVYIGSIPLGEEEEYQTDDDKLVYDYIGPNYLKVWIPLKDINKGVN